MPLYILILAAIGAISLLILGGRLVTKVIKIAGGARPIEESVSEPVTQPVMSHAETEEDEDELMAAVMAAAVMMLSENEYIRKITRITPVRYENREKPILEYSYTFAEA